MSVTILHGLSEEVLKTIPDNSIDSVVTDPPYGLGKEPDPNAMLAAWLDHGYLEVKGAGFMGKKWDAFVPQPVLWREVYRVLKPGGHVLSFFGTRTYDWGVMAMRLAGFEIRDCIQWLYGSGFPKSMDISKAIDKEAGAEREVVGVRHDGASNKSGETIFSDDAYSWNTQVDITAPATAEAKQWAGWGTALKPANEPIVLARKPLQKGCTVADNVLLWGTGGINIDGCRVGEDVIKTQGGVKFKGDGIYNAYNEMSASFHIGRFPANVILDEEAGRLLDLQAPNTGAAAPVRKGYSGESNGTYGDFAQKDDDGATFRGDSGGASRFFYCPKAAKSERNAGGVTNDHPTVKPVALMRYLIRMVTPPGGTVLDPFGGSGTTGVAAIEEYVYCTLIEADAHNVEIAQERVNHAQELANIKLFEQW